MTDLTTEQLIEQAHEAFNHGRLSARTAAYASLAAVNLLQEFLTLARDGLAYDWSAVLLPGGGTLTCACGATLFTEYPTVGELPWIICASAQCDAVWTLGESPDTHVQPVLLRGGAAVRTFAQWQQNDLVRYRDGETEIVYLVQRPALDTPGGRWWHAMVLRCKGETNVIVGESGLLDSRNPQYELARFPE